MWGLPWCTGSVLGTIRGGGMVGKGYGYTLGANTVAGIGRGSTLGDGVRALVGINVVSIYCRFLIA